MFKLNQNCSITPKKYIKIFLKCKHYHVAITVSDNNGEYQNFYFLIFHTIVMQSFMIIWM